MLLIVACFKQFYIASQGRLNRILSKLANVSVLANVSNWLDASAS